MNSIKLLINRICILFIKNAIVMSMILISHAVIAQQIPVRSAHDHTTHNCSRVTAKPTMIPAATPSIATAVQKKSSCKYTTNEQWANLSTTALLTEMKQNATYDCYRIMFRSDAYSPALFTNQKIQSVANELKRLAPTYDGTADSQVYGLTIYLHVALYIDFVNKDVTINTASYDAMRAATAALANNSNLFAINTYALNVFREYAIIASDMQVRYDANVLKALETTIREIVEDRKWKTIKDPALLKQYLAVRNQIYDAIFFPVDAPYEAALSARPISIELLGTLAVDQEIIAQGGNFKFLWSNAIGGLSRLATSDVLIGEIQEELARIIRHFDRLSPSWVVAMVALNEHGDCKAYNLCENPLSVKQELEAFLFPKTVTYDDDAMRIRTGISDEKIQGLYHAAKQVQAQFFRLLQTDEPVAGDTNDTINMVIFKSKQDYDDYAPFLYGILTNNGGIYIETRATFYTWDRTVGVESSLSLESLFRHEYCHYLQGRYLVPGSWGGSNPMYANSRLVWYEEGMADFFAGATDVNGIQFLAQNATNIINRNGDWPSLNTVFDSNYASGNNYHYTYGNATWYNWYLNDFQLLKRFFEYTRNNDIAGFDALVASLRTTGEASYTNFLRSVKDQEVVGWQPQTSWADDNQITLGAISDIQQQLGTVAQLSDISVALDAAASYRRFRIEGKLRGTTPTGNSNAQAVLQLHEAANSVLKALRENERINNFNYTVGYFKNVTTDGVPTAEMVITGPLKDAGISDAPSANFTVSNTETIAGGVVEFTNTSLGYADELDWEFPASTSPTISNQQNPRVTYPTAGVYDVSLTAKGVKGENKRTKEGYIKVYKAADQSYCAASNRDSSNDIYITNVALGRLAHASGINLYADYTSQVAVISRQQEETLQIKVRNPSWNYNAVGAWIDWNQDGDFTDPGEEVLHVYGATTAAYTATIKVPSQAISGTTRMRVRLAYGAERYIVPCDEVSSSGEVEDYSVVVVDGAGSVNKPPQITFLSPNEGASFVQREQLKVETMVEDDGRVVKTTLAVDGEVIAEDKVAPYQWSHIDALNFLAPGKRELTVTAYDDEGASTSASVFVLIEKAPIVYCDASNQKPKDLHITKVDFKDIANASTYSEKGYSDYTTMNTVVAIGDEVPLSVAIKNAHWIYNDVTVWIDWNQDGDFIDQQEEVFTKFGAGPYAANITVPAIAKTDVPLRMRVRISYGRKGAALPCGLKKDIGEVEDYTVYVTTTETKPIADFMTKTTSVNLAATVAFEDRSSANVTTWFWEFEGGTPATSTDTNPQIKYTTSGQFAVKLTVTNAQGEDIKEEKEYIEVVDTDPIPSCTDGIQNGDETGIDCGGSCTPCATPLPNPTSYCEAGKQSTNYIERVTFGSIDHTSGNSAYSDVTEQSTTLQKGATQVLVVDPHYTTSNWHANVVGAWIDWNQDGDFTDAGEEVLMKPRGEGNATTDVVVPAAAKTGETRLRVRYRWWNAPAPCGSEEGDEVEDYTVLIEDGDTPPIDTSGTIYVDVVDTEVSASDTWKFFRIEVGDNRDYGLWYSNGAIRLVSYGKGVVCENATSNVRFIESGQWINETSGFVENPNSYVVSKDSYTAWKGKTGFIGFRFEIDGHTHYGWFRVAVAADGLSYTLLDYAYQSNANTPIYTVIHRDAGTVITKSEEITVWPNPFRKEFQVVMNGIQQGMIQVEVIDVHGKKIVSETYQTPPAIVQIGQGLSSSGIYFVKIKTLDTVYIKRLLKL